MGGTSIPCNSSRCAQADPGIMDYKIKMSNCSLHFYAYRNSTNQNSRQLLVDIFSFKTVLIMLLQNCVITNFISMNVKQVLITVEWQLLPLPKLLIFSFSPKLEKKHSQFL